MIKTAVTLLALSIFIFVGNSYAVESNGVVEAPFTDDAPLIDGQWTTSDEWKNASVTELTREGHVTYVLIMHDQDFLYLMYDAVTDQTNPGLTFSPSNPSQFAIGHKAILFLDTDNDGGNLDVNDIRILAGKYYETYGEEKNLLFF